MRGYQEARHPEDLPGEQAITVRSIQKHDDDFDWAAEGDRVGLALKNIESDDLDRGFVLSSDPAIQTRTSLEAQATLVKYWPAPLTAGRCSTSGTGCSSSRFGWRRCGRRRLAETDAHARA